MSLHSSVDKAERKASALDSDVRDADEKLDPRAYDEDQGGLTQVTIPSLLLGACAGREDCRCC